MDQSTPRSTEVRKGTPPNQPIRTHVTGFLLNTYSVHTCTFRGTPVRTYIFSHKSQICFHIQILISIHIHMHIRRHIHTEKDKYKYKYTCIDTDTDIYTHTYTYT